MKIICAGRNYAEHARELKNEVPTNPVLFMKPSTAVVNRDMVLYYPEFTTDLHYEAELVVKIAKNGKHIAEKFAHKYYEQVTVGIDFTARDVQQKLKEKGLPWEIAKAFDGSAAVGNFVSLEDGQKPADLSFSLHKNGEEVQAVSASEMIFSVDKLIAYASEYFTLNMGDLIFTGTPAGVGPVQIHDRLEGFLNGQPVLDLLIK